MNRPRDEATRSSASRRIAGRGASPGIAVGPVHVLSVSPPSPSELSAAPAGPSEVTDARVETDRLVAALDDAAAEVRQLAARVRREVGADEADIFEAQAAFAEDPVLRRRALALVDEGRTAIDGVTAAFDDFRQRLAASDSEVLSARVTDIDDVVARVRRLLGDAPARTSAPDIASVIVADELTPSQTAELPRDAIVALVTAKGSPTSHAAILSRALGVPCVVGATGIVEAAEHASEAVVDGSTGEIILDPDEAAVDSARRAIERTRATAASRARFATRPGATADGHRVEVAANIGGAGDLIDARAVGAEGSGLVRTELLYLDRKDAPSIDEQCELVVEALRAFPAHRVVVRTLDVGADKPLPFITTRDEPNPALGVRGVRLSLAEPDLLRDQLTALLRAGERTEPDRRRKPATAGRLAVMLPMVTQRSELVAARDVLAELREATGTTDLPVEVGIMIEIPVAALGIERLIDLCDFVSIGTNDLVQYLFAADRLNGEVDVDADAAHPIVLDVIAGVVDAAHRAGAWVGVCGESAGDPLVARALTGLGVDELSMAPAAILAVREALARVTLADCRRAVERARSAADAGEARALLAAMPETGDADDVEARVEE
jgi:multiphosphoryl transfer protein